MNPTGSEERALLERDSYDRARSTLRGEVSSRGAKRADSELRRFSNEQLLETEMCTHTIVGAHFPALWPYLILCAAVAACIDLGHLHQGEHADSIIPILVSLQRWTFFFWEEDRFGMLLPLIALPFRHPLANLLVQEWLGTLSGLAAVFLLARYMLRYALWPVAATLAIAYSIIFVPEGIRFDWFVAQQYGTSLTLALAALLLLEADCNHRWQASRLPTAIALILLANWVNFSVSIVLIPLIFIRYLLSFGSARLLVQPKVLSSRDRWHVGQKLAAYSEVRSLGLLAFGMGAARAMSRLVPHTYATSLRPVSLKEWPTAWAKLAIFTWNGVFPKPGYLIVLLVPAILGMVFLLSVPTLRNHSRQIFAGISALASAAVPYWVLVATMAHVKMNQYFPRYSYPSLLFIELAITALAVVPVLAVPAKHLQRYTLPLNAGILLIAAVYSYGFPSLATVRSDIDQRFGTATQEILDAQADLVAGDYWKVWPAVFHANLVLYERGEHKTIFGLTSRGLPTRTFWSNVPLDQVRVAVHSGDEQKGEYWLRFYGLPLKSVVCHPRTLL